MAKLADIIAATVEFCTRKALAVSAAVAVMACVAAIFSVQHFALSTETEALLSSALRFRQLEAQFDKAFPDSDPPIIVVIDGATPEIASSADERLAAALAARADLFTRVRQPGGTDLFQRNGLLFKSVAEVRDTTEQMIAAQPFLGPIAADPSLRGIMDALSTALTGVERNEAKLDDLARPLKAIDAAIDAANQGKRSFFSWRTLLSNSAPDRAELRRMILLDPKLDYSQLEAGQGPAQYVRQAARTLGLDSSHGVRVRLTGSAMLADEEFATLAENIGVIAALMLTAIVVMVWLAVRSVRMVAAILLSTFAGLTIAAAFGLLVFGRFNVISVAFIPLFVGLGIDFGIQFAVRFRAEQRTEARVAHALTQAGAVIGPSLALAAAAISVGFLAFVPTQYVGLSQLGAIAGFGLLIAFGLSITFLPALATLLAPPGALPESNAAPLAKTDAFVLSHRRSVLTIAAVSAAVGMLLLPLLHFDFNPLHLRSSKTESVATFLDLARDPDNTPYFANEMSPTLGAAKTKAAQLARLPAVANTVTLADFIPDQQAPKLALIQDASFLLDATLNPFVVAAAPTDAALVGAIEGTAAHLRAAAAAQPGSATTQVALALAGHLAQLAQAPPAARALASDALVSGLAVQLDQMRKALTAEPISLGSLPDDLKADWLASDGRARIAIYPRGDANDNKVLERFAAVVARAAPDATGAPISVQESGRAVVQAFFIAGALSFAAITALLFIALRRAIDVVITMTPIVLTGVLTLGTCVIIGQPLNFANIIALPLLFGIGVAFHIYFVMAWRAGDAHLLQSSLARGVFFSALTTATGFGSLWLSSHPGTASMGKLLMISLVWTLVSALVFQPALMGAPPSPNTKAAPAP